MKGFIKLCLTLFIAAAAAAIATPATAQASRTWVSGVGDDLNPCSRTAPCKTFAGAISKTAVGGEINCLDPGGFGAVSITKSITIDCTGTLGGVLASSTTGILVNTAGVNVVLRGLTINGGPPAITGLFGIRFLQGNSLVVEDCIIQNFVSTSAGAGFGIRFSPSTLADLIVINSTVTHNGAAASGGGIHIQPTGASGGARVQLSNVRIEANLNNAFTIDTTSNPSAAGVTAILDHVYISRSTNGINVQTPAGGSDAFVTVTDSSVASNTGTGILANGNFARLFVADTTVFRNGTGVSAIGGAQVNTFGNNRLQANTSNGAFTAPVTPSS